jgi:tryptophan 2,3-dioxygenase
MSRKPTAYWDYLQLDQLLSLQGGVEGDERELSNDEVMFIVIHQIDELWLKLAIRELVSVRNLFAQNPVPEQSLASAVRGLRRLALLFQQLGAHFALMETMTTRDYLGFRDKLSPASGFQSAQLREIEILLGLDDAQRVPLGSEHSYLDALKNHDGTESAAFRRVSARLEDRPSLHDAVRGWLCRAPIQGSRPDDANDSAHVRTFVEAFLRANEREVRSIMRHALDDARSDDDRRLVEARYEKQLASARAFLFAEDVPDAERDRVCRARAALLFIESYRELPLLAWPREALDTIIALEQAFLIFRQRHARMVERIIGRRTGTGGSAGVDYLDATAIKYRVFKDVWAVRTVLLREGALPPLENAEVYGFAARTTTPSPI